MTDTESPIGERVAAVETDIKHILNGIVRIEGSVARIENVVIKEKTEKLESNIARVEGRITEMKDDLRQTLLAAMSENRKALYVLCGTVIAGIVAALLKGSVF